ncbi:MAG: hypothetical protein WAV28_10510 [Sedimentisphaerales bacterium]
MQNKPNSLNVQIYINIYDTKDYKNFIPLVGPKNKPNQTQFLKIMNINFYATRYYDRNPTFAANNSNVEFTTVFSDGARFITPKADKIALKIYPFGIDCPIVLKEMLFSIYGKDYD